MRIKYKKGSRMSLTDIQERYVRMNYKRMEVKRMAERIKVPTSRIYSFLYLHGLKVRANPVVKTEVKSKFFNVHAKDNWLIG